MSAGTLTYSGKLTTMSCWCGIHFAIPTELFDNLHRTGNNGYCPLGHTFSWNTTTADRERARRESAEATNTHLRDQLAAERRQHAATKGKLTKTKKRVAGGACPCCDRSFVDLARHMAGQHPDYVDGGAK